MRYVGPLEELFDQPRLTDAATTPDRDRPPGAAYSPTLTDSRQQLLENAELNPSPNKTVHETHPIKDYLP